MKKIILLSTLAIVIQFTYTASAQAGWVEFFFPSLRTEEVDPSDTLQAPFADEEAQEAAPVPKGQLPENALALDKAHRDVASIREWLVTSTSEVMTFDSEDFAAELEEHGLYFNEAGKQEYTSFLQDKGVIKVLDSRKYQVRSFVEDVPLILNEGPVSGSYRWLFEVPIMVSYLDRDMQDYKESKPINQQMVLTVQIGRSPVADNKEGVLIEHWNGKVKKDQK